MKFKTSMLLGLIVIGILFGITFYMYPGLPDPMPSHWNASGEVDGYMAKPWGAFILPLSCLGTWAMFLLIVYISPQGFRVDKFKPVIGILQLATTGFMAGIGVLVLLSAQGSEIKFENFIIPAVGLLLIVLGNYMSKLRKNFFVGIKTPWTLASDEVWDRTHRFAGWIFVIGGILLFFQPLVGKAWYMVSIILIAALLPLIYSFVIYRQLEGFEPEPEDD